MSLVPNLGDSHSVILCGQHKLVRTAPENKGGTTSPTWVTKVERKIEGERETPLLEGKKIAIEQKTNKKKSLATNKKKSPAAKNQKNSTGEP